VDVYVTNWGPTGSILYRDRPPALGIFRVVVDGLPVGIAYPVGHVPSRKAPAAVFRLEAEGVDQEARWVCVGRRFVERGRRRKCSCIWPLRKMEGVVSVCR
jgi:hypothetical protein